MPVRTTAARLVDRTVFAGLVTIVVAAPLAFASVEAWAWAPIASLSAVLLGLWSLSLPLGQPVAVRPARVARMLMALTGVLIWSVLQSAPWTPDTLHHPAWDDAAALLGHDLDGAISLTPAASQAGALRLAMYGAISWLTLQLARDRARAYTLVGAVVIAGAINAAYGLLESLSPVTLITWLPDNGRVSGMFVNPNHFATHAGLALLAATALAVAPLQAALGPALGPRERLRRGLEAVFTQAGRRWLVCALLAAALLLSVSRGGILAGATGVAALAWALNRGGVVSGAAGRAVAVVGAVVIVLVLLAVGEDTPQRFAESGASADHRLRTFAATLQAIAERPWLGTGLGSFHDVFAAYQPAALREAYYHAHNTYLENALELGVPAAIVLTLVPLMAVRRCLRGLRARRRDQLFPALGVAASVLVGAHALGDFSVEIPGVAITYVVLLAVGVSQSWPSGGRGRSA